MKQVRTPVSINTSRAAMLHTPVNSTQPMQIGFAQFGKIMYALAHCGVAGSSTRSPYARYSFTACFASTLHCIQAGVSGIAYCDRGGVA